MDIVVESTIILELKSCEKVEPIHKAQLLTYLKLSGLNLGLLLNFNVAVMRNGIVRVVNELKKLAFCVLCDFAVNCYDYFNQTKKDK